MRHIFVLSLFPLVLFSSVIHTHMTVKGVPFVALRTIVQSFVNAGYRLESESFEYNGETIIWIANAFGNKELKLEAVSASLKEQGWDIGQLETQKNELYLTLHDRNAYWNVHELGREEAVEIKKVIVPQWFRVEELDSIRIESPYNTVWYPDITVLDHNMRVLRSWRLKESKEDVELQLPNGACYLKVSNTQSMKLLKEGMWIESLNLGR